MRSSRNFYSNENKDIIRARKELIKNKDEQGRVHIVLATNAFSDVNETLLVTNSTISNLVSEVRMGVEPYSVKDKIVLDIYETKKSDELSRQVVTSGFKRYVNSCIYGLKQERLTKFILFFSLFLVGVIIEAHLYNFIPENTLPLWVSKTVEVLSTLFIWQFGGYMAFEYIGESKKLKRLKQIANVDFNIKLWN